jgi:hypothetical protein
MYSSTIPIRHHPLGRHGSGAGQRGVGSPLWVWGPLSAAFAVWLGRGPRGGALSPGLVCGLCLPRGHLLQEEQVPLGGGGGRGGAQGAPSTRSVLFLIFFRGGPR